jgi:hypothetical protein
MAVLNAHVLVIPGLLGGLYQPMERAKSYFGPPGAFSSEVETGSRQENASNQESGAPLRFDRRG